MCQVKLFWDRFDRVFLRWRTTRRASAAAAPAGELKLSRDPLFIDKLRYIPSMVERLHGMTFHSHRDARDATLDWLLWYNGSRMHSTLGYLSPAQFEQQANARTHALAA